MQPWKRTIATDNLIYFCPAAKSFPECEMNGARRRKRNAFSLPKKDSDKLLGKSCQLVLAYLAQIPDDEPRPLAVETMLEVPLIDPETGVDLGIPLRGIIDLVLDERGGAVICDFKTAASSQQPLEVCHEVQLGCYALLYRALSGDVESGLEIRTLVKTKVPQIAVYRYGARSEEQIRRLFAVVRAYLEDLRRGEFLYRPGWGCRTCSFRNEC